MGLAGVVLALVLLALPVRAGFVDDPVLRLRDLDPELALPALEVSCGLPLASLRARAEGPAFVEVARADACRSAARLRVAAAVAVGAVLVAGGFLVGQWRPRPGTPNPREVRTVTA